MFRVDDKIQCCILMEFSFFFSQKDERKKCPTDRWTSDHAESLKCKWNVRQNFEHKSDCFSVSEFQAVNLTLC